MKFNYIKTISLLTVICLAQLFWAKTSMAQYDNPTKKDKSMFVDKQVRSVEMNRYYDNLDAATKKFNKGDLIEFTIYIENNGQSELNNIVIRDILPSNLKLELYDGKYNQADRSLEWKIDVLLPTQNKKYFIRATVLKDNQAGGVWTNQVRGWTDSPTSTSDQDTSSYFVTGKGLVIPKTGSEGLLIQTILTLSLIGGAVGIRKYARGY